MTQTTSSSRHQITDTARRPLAAPVVALLGGLVASTAFAPIAFAPAAVFGPAIALWIAGRTASARWGAACGLAYGIGFAVATFRWLADLDPIAFTVLAPLQALFWIPVGVVAARGARFGPWRWAVATAATWTLAEAVRARVPASGFEWGQLGLATADTPVRHAAAAVGALGVTALLATVAATLAAVVLFPAARSWKPAAVALSLLGLATAIGLAPWTRSAGALDVAVVQVSDPCPGVFAADCPGYGDRLLDAFVAGTAAIPDTVDVVVWGEDALGGDATLSRVGERLVAVADRLPAPILAGSSTFVAPNRFIRWNVLYDTDGAPLSTYAKRVPVPFGEYVPFRDVLGGISDVGRLVPLDMLPGDSTDPIDVPAGAATAPIGTVVSWEVTFSRLVRGVARQADGLATLTTVSSYGTSTASEHLLSAAQVRAAEHHKPMVVSATTGRSAFIAADGTRQATSALFAADRLHGRMELRSGLTPYARFGDLPVVVVAIAVTLVAYLWRRGDRRSHSGAGTGDTGSRDGGRAAEHDAVR